MKPMITLLAALALLSPASATETQGVHLEEMWRAGGADGDVLFGQILRAEADADGNVYLLDTQLCEVPVFAPDGTHVKTLSREGEGPGETRQPVDLVCEGDPVNDRLFRVRDDMVVIIRGAARAFYAAMTPSAVAEEDADEDPNDLEVICYRLPR